MPKKKPSLGRTSKGGRTKAKRSREDEDVRAAYVQLEGQLDATVKQHNEDMAKCIAQHREQISEIEQLNKRLRVGSALVLGGLTGRHRRRSSIGGADDHSEGAEGAEGAEGSKLELETLGQRLLRLDAEIAHVSRATSIRTTVL